MNYTVALNDTAKASDSMMSSSTLAPVLAQNESPIFLQSKTAQVIAGTCVWIALFLTCQQVRFYKIIFSMQVSSLLLITFSLIQKLVLLLFKLFGT